MIFRSVCLVLSLFSMVMLASPEAAFDFVGFHPPISNAMARMAGFAGMFLFFAMFSGRSKFGGESDEPRPETRVEHLVHLVPRDISSLLEGNGALRKVMAFTVEGRKIQAIKTLRLATHMGLKDAKETVERLQDALRQARP